MKKRKLKRNKFIVLILLILIITGIIFYINYNLPTNKLKQLNYSKTSIKVIEKYNLKEDIIDNKIKSKVLNKVLESNYFIKDNYSVYIKLDYYNYDNYIENVNKLIGKKYNYEEINNIYKKINNNDIDFILDNDYISNLNDYLSVSIFETSKINRYIAYKKRNPKLNYEDNILTVNIGLDKPYYSNDITVTNYDYTTLINKYNKLPNNYEANDLVEVSSEFSSKEIYLNSLVKDKFEEMANDMKKFGLSIKIISGYRTHAYQNSLYNNYVKQYGFKEAEVASARPGYSEHQTGFALDVASGNNNFTKFENSREYNWMKDNSYKYGFILRYPKGKEVVTGYMFESWHYRYLGEDLAKSVYDSGLTYDEYYHLYIKKQAN